MITRRGFLSGLAASLAAPLPERRRVYSFPREPMIIESSSLLYARPLIVRSSFNGVTVVPDAETARRLFGWDLREFFDHYRAPIIYAVARRDPSEPWRAAEV